MTHVSLGQSLPVVTVDTVALLTPEARAAEILEKQKQRLVGTAKLLVAATLDALEDKPAIADSAKHVIDISDRGLAKFRADHPDAVAYGLRPYTLNDDALKELARTFKTELGTTFGTATLHAVSDTIRVQVGVAGAGTALVVAGTNAFNDTLAKHDAKQIAGHVANRKVAIADRRELFKSLAASPAMQGMFAALESAHKCRSIVALNAASSAYLRPDGVVSDYWGAKATDEVLMDLHLDTVNTHIDGLLEVAARAEIPKSRAWARWYQKSY